MILITRPKEQSKNLETVLNLKGYKTYLESLYKIKYLKKKVFYNKNNHYIFPSIHSVQSLINSKQIKNFREANILAIGKKVKQKLINAGCKKIIATFNNSNALIDKIKKNKSTNCSFVYLCSNIINEDFLKQTDRYQVKLQKKIIYKTIPVLKFQKKIIKDLKLGNISGATFLSKLASDTFLSLLSRHNCLSASKNINIYCISQRVAAPFIQKRFSSVYISPKPNEDALIQSIKKRHFK